VICSLAIPNSLSIIHLFPNFSNEISVYLSKFI